MHFKIYIIDDRSDKTSALPAFIKWLKKCFPQCSFSPGFTAPINAATDSQKIASALEDPLGVILLDAWMSGTEHRSAGQNLRKVNGLELNCEPLKTIWKDLHGHRETELAATIVCVAQMKKARVVYISIEQIADDRNLAAGLPHYENLPWYNEEDRNKGYTWNDREDKETMARVLSTFHPDRAVNDAIVFAIAPPKPDKFWKHNDLVKSKSHNLALAQWLGCESIHSDSAKALLCVDDEMNAPWTVVASTSDDYNILPSVLQLVCSKMGIAPVDFNFKSFRLPTRPGLPFLMAVRALLYDMQECDKFHAPSKIVFVETQDQYTLRFELPNIRKDSPSQSINMAMFKNALEQARKRRAKEKGLATSVKTSKGHRTTSRLLDLEQAKLKLVNAPTGEVSEFFCGISGDVVRLDFDERKGSEAIVVSWMNI